MAPNTATEPAFDAEDTLLRLGNDLELFCELVESFRRDSVRGMADIRHSIDKGDAVALAHAAHALRGVVSIFAAAPAMRVTQAIERDACAGAVADAAHKLSGLEDILDSLETALTRFSERVA